MDHGLATRGGGVAPSARRCRAAVQRRATRAPPGGQALPPAGRRVRRSARGAAPGGRSRSAPATTAATSSPPGGRGTPPRRRAAHATRPSASPAARTRTRTRHLEDRGDASLMVAQTALRGK